MIRCQVMELGGWEELAQTEEQRQSISVNRKQVKAYIKEILYMIFIILYNLVATYLSELFSRHLNYIHCHLATLAFTLLNMLKLSPTPDYHTYSLPFICLNPAHSSGFNLTSLLQERLHWNMH